MFMFEPFKPCRCEPLPHPRLVPLSFRTVEVENENGYPVRKVISVLDDRDPNEGLLYSDFDITPLVRSGEVNKLRLCPPVPLSPLAQANQIMAIPLDSYVDLFENPAAPAPAPAAAPAAPAAPAPAAE